MKTILHSDLNNFYASAECLVHPELKIRPVAVCGDVNLRHGVVLAKNYIAKSFGIKTGMTVWEAKILCKDVIIRTADFKTYLALSKEVRKIYESYTDKVEAFGIDECWLDVTESVGLFGSGEKIADDIRERIKKETGLTASVGVSYNKIYAKLGSDMKKPDATTVITKENREKTIFLLPVSDLLYVGRSTTVKLNKLNIMTIGDLAKTDPELLKEHLGQWGAYLYAFARGEDQTPVRKVGEEQEIKSIGNSLTNYRDLENESEVRILVDILCDSIAERLSELGNMRANTVHIYIKDSILYSYAKQGKTAYATCSSTDISDTAMKLFKECYAWINPVRCVGVSVSGIESGDNYQLSFLPEKERAQKREKLEKAVIKIRRKHGYRAITKGNVLNDRMLAGLNIKEEHTIHPESYFHK